MSRLFPILLALLLTAAPACAGLNPHADRPKIDFDTLIQTLNPYGTWSRIDGVWAWTPLDHQAPFTHGRWVYTDYGWCWLGALAHSWATEHYGYWKRGADKVWSWYPLSYWLPEPIEIRATPTYIGWRSAAVDDNGTFVESPAERYTKTDEWTFVTREQFANPITPTIVAKPAVAEEQLENSTECRHSYTTYRPLDRPGPHPADFLALCRDGGMFAPTTLADKLAEQKQTAPPAAVPAGLGTTGLTAPSVAPAAAPDGTAALVKSDDGADESPADARQVKYWVTMNLPDPWAARPPDAKPEELYLFRPEFFQDEDGIERRIAYWIDPKSRSLGTQGLSAVLAGSDKPAAPAATSESAPSRGAFRSPLDDSYHGGPVRPALPTTNAPAAPSGAAQ
jgi:hypothetical protein